MHAAFVFQGGKKRELTEISVTDVRLVESRSIRGVSREVWRREGTGPLPPAAPSRGESAKMRSKHFTLEKVKGAEEEVFSHKHSSK